MVNKDKITIDSDQLDQSQIDTARLEVKLPAKLEYLSIDKIGLTKEAIQNEVPNLNLDRVTVKEAGSNEYPDVIHAVSMMKEGKSVNEDAFFIYYNRKKDIIASAVFDGMGGEMGGDLASSTINRYIQEGFKELEPDSTPRDAMNKITEATQSAIKELNILGETNPDLKKADTTLTIFFSVADQDSPGKRRNFVVNSGDSSAYKHSKKSNKLEKLTLDDSLVQIYMNMGSMDSLGAKISQYKAVVSSTLRADTSTGRVGRPIYKVVEVGDLEEGDTIWLLSDGVTDQFREDDLDGSKSNELQTYIAEYGLSPEELIAAGILRCRQGISGLSKNDDTTAIRVRIPNFESIK